MMREQEQNPEFLRRHNRPIVHSAETDISIKDIRENTCTTDVAMKVVATIYAYIDRLTGNTGLNALEIGYVTKSWEKFWYRQIQHWKRNHETILTKLIGGSPEEAENALMQAIQEATAQEQNREKSETFVQATQEMLRAVKKAVPTTTDFNLLMFGMITLPEMMLEYPARLSKVERKYGKKAVSRGRQEEDREWLTENDATRHTVLRKLVHKPVVRAVETDRVERTVSANYYLVHLKLMKNVTIDTIHEQIKWYDAKGIPVDVRKKADEKGMTFIPECTYYYTGQTKSSKDHKNDMYRMCEIGKEMVLVVGTSEAEGTKTLSGIVTRLTKAELGISGYRKDDALYSRGTPADIYMITADVKTVQWMSQANEEGVEVIIHGIGASAVSIESTQLLNALNCSVEYLLMRHGMGRLRLNENSDARRTISL